jgi:hypothetical protein
MLCSPPSERGQTESTRRELRKAVQAERDLISELSQGDGQYRVHDSCAPYLTALERYRGAYAPVDQRMMKEWESTRSRLLRLRDVARTHLWPQLHGEWLPRLDAEGAAYLPKLNRLVQKAVREARFQRYLNTDSTIGWGLVPTVSAIGATFGHRLGLDPVVPAVASSVAGVAAANRFADARAQRGELRIFYEKALRS